MPQRAVAVRSSRRLALAAGLALVGGCATKIEPPIAGYTCCNLKISSGWISSDNVLGGPMLPAGEPVRLESVKRGVYVYGTIGDTGVGLRDDSAKNAADAMAWVRRVVVAENPRTQMATWPAATREAVQYGKVRVGMTRAQVATALGYPSRKDTPDPAAKTWRYWTAQDDDPVDLHFGDDDVLQRLSGTPSALATVEAGR